MSDDEMLAALNDCIARLEASETEAAAIRDERREVLTAMRTAGWTLERIGRSVGRTKQTITQWLRGGTQ